VNARRYDCSQRPDLLGRLLGQLEAGHDSSGRCFDIVDVQTEAFGFIVAGSHTTAASTTLLLWHMLHHPEAVRRVREEIQSLTSVDGNAVYPFEALKRLKYLQAAISEGFRVNPVFIAPLMRVVPSHGHDIAGASVPGGTEVSVCNHVVHHNGDIFCSVLHKYMPERCFDAEFSGAANLITFGAGHRACIGRNIAMAEISKLIATLLSRYDIESVDKDRLEQDTRDTRVNIAPTVSFGAAELKGPFLVRLLNRQSL
jgi:cytochrome P450